MNTTMIAAAQAARVAVLAGELGERADLVGDALARVDAVERRAAAGRADALAELREALDATLAELADPAPAVPAPDWSAALCAQADPEAWFPEKGVSPASAKRVCRHCPIRRECLDWALATDQRFGVWGGLSERDRRLVKRRGAESATPGPESAGQTGSTGMNVKVTIGVDDRGNRCSDSSSSHSDGEPWAA